MQKSTMDHKSRFITCADQYVAVPAATSLSASDLFRPETQGSTDVLQAM